MQPRLAKKIMQRVQSGDVNRTSYRLDQVEDAFRVMGTPLDQFLLAPWANKPAQEDPAVLAARIEANRQHRQENLARLEARKKARRAHIAEANARTRFLGDHLGLDPQVIAKHVQEAKGYTPLNRAVHDLQVQEDQRVVAHLETQAQDMAVAAAREVFQQTMQKGAVPKSVTIEPQDEGEPDYYTWTVHELRASVKSRGVKGYSSMTKSELIAALTAP